MVLPELLSVEEVARICRVHQVTVRRHIKQGKLKAVKIGGRIRVKRGDVGDLLEPVPHHPNPGRWPTKKLSEEEVARRKALFDQTMQLRREIGPIGISVDELIRQGRSEEEEADA